MFRTAKSDTYSTEVAGYGCIVRSISIGAYFQFGIFVGQLHQFGKVARKFCSLGFNLAFIYFTCTTVQRDKVTFFQNNTVYFYCTGFVVDVQSTCT